VGAAIVSNPLCLHASARSLSRPWTVPYLYNLALAIRLRQYLWQHRDALSAHVQARSAQPPGGHQRFWLLNLLTTHAAGFWCAAEANMQRFVKRRVGEYGRCRACLSRRSGEAGAYAGGRRDGGVDDVAL